MNIAAVVPFLNEERHLPRMLESIAAQSRPPDRLLLVDDGSTDASAAIAADFSSAHDFAAVLRRSPRPTERDRLAGAAEIRAFAWGVDRIDMPWDVVAKLDADVCLTTETLRTLEREFAADARLGMAGTYLREPAPAGLRRLRIRPEHVHGATKFYRRACYAEIAPLPDFIGWDMIDEVRARMRGWRTQSFAMPGGDPLHLRPRGSYDGMLRAFRRGGEGAWAMGEHPLHVVLLGAVRMRERPYVLGGVNYVVGWANAGIHRRRRAEAELREHVRRDQLARIRARARRSVRGLLPPRG